MKNIVEKYNAMETAMDLKKNKLTLSDYYCLGNALEDLIDGQIVNTIIENVAKWCKRNGLKVTKNEMGWDIKE